MKNFFQKNGIMMLAAVTVVAVPMSMRIRGGSYTSSAPTAATSRSLARYGIRISLFVTRQILMARASSPLGAPPALTQSPAPIPMNSAPTMAAVSGISANPGQSLGNCSNTA